MPPALHTPSDQVGVHVIEFAALDVAMTEPVTATESAKVVAMVRVTLSVTVTVW